jgi:uncharacterized repeat protein (TIGR03803 family)
VTLRDVLTGWFARRRNRSRNSGPHVRRTYLLAELLENRCVPAAALTSLGSLDLGTGYQPWGGLVVDGGNPVGTASQGGASGFGTLFEVKAGNPTPITAFASFDGSGNGANPRAGLVQDISGNLFGTAYQGGPSDQGTVFEAHRGNPTITMLASFDGTHGANPKGGVIVDASDNLFGTTSQGGDADDGIVFEVMHGSGTVTMLATFTGDNGAHPGAGVIMDANGNLFGTTDGGGDFSAGTVWELKYGSGTITTLASFNSSGPVFPSGLVMDSAGNLFGTSNLGGSAGKGSVFEVVKGSGMVTTLGSFVGANGTYPVGGLLIDAAGNFFGTTTGGGDSDNGTVFEVVHGSATISTQVSFEDNTDVPGSSPLGNLAMDQNGSIYGTTYAGGATEAGTVFELPPPPVTIISPSTFPPWTVNRPGYNQTISTNGGAGAKTFSTSGGLPPGLTLSSGGVVSGTPTVAGHFTFTVTVMDANGGSASQTFPITINTAVSVSTATLPNWTVNRPGYNQTISAAGGTGTLTLSVSGNVPTGLTLSSGGVLSGTPKVAGVYTFTVTATDTLGASASQTYTVTINASVAIATTMLPDWTVNQPGYNQTIATSGGTGSITESLSGTLPPGLTLSSNSVLSGTPTATGSFTFTITAMDSLGSSGSRTFTVHINPPVSLGPSTLPPGVINVPYQQTITASGGTAPVALAVSGVTGSIPGLTVPTTGTGSLVISGTPTATGTETFTVTATDASGASASITYTITVSSAITLSPGTLQADTVNIAYNQTITASGGSGTLTLTVSGVSGSIPGLTIPASGTGNLVFSSTPTATGTVSFTVTATDGLGAMSTGSYSITVNPSLTLSPTTLPGDTINTPYSQTITTSGGTGTATLSVSGLTGAIPGLTVPSSGMGTLVFSGTPTATGTVSFTVTATDSVGAVTSATYSITVNPALSLSPGTLPADTANVPYNQTITTSGGTGTVTLTVSAVNGAIAGLNLPANGTGSLTISGTPTAAGTETFTVTAMDSAGATTSVNYTLVVNSILTFSPASLLGGSPNTAYNQTITVNGGTGTIQLAVSDVTGNIPGLTIPTNGTGNLVISGTPTGPGAVTFTVTATDAVGAVAQTSYTINVTSATAYLSMPTTGFSGSTNSTLTDFPIRISQLSDGTHVGLATASIVLSYPTGVFNFPVGGNQATSFVHLGSVPLSDTAGSGGAADWNLTANSPADGTLKINLSAVVGDPITSDTGGGSLVTLDLPILGTAPLGNVTLTIVDNASGHTQVIGNNGQLALSPPPPYSGSITVTLGSLSISPSVLPAGDINTHYSQTIAASAGFAPFTYAVTAGTLPPGLTFTSTSGVLSGTPTATGSYAFTVTATDSRGATASQNYTLVIDPTPSITTTAVPAATAGTSYSVTLHAAGGSSPFTFSVPQINLPPGLSLTADGVLSGTPTTAGSFAFTVTATDAAGASATKNVTLTVTAGPATQFFVTTPAGTTVQAGSGFLVVVQAADQYGNPVTSGYTGPSTVFPSLTPPSSASSLPNSVSINSHGLGLFVATLDQVGTFTIAVANGSFAGSASPVRVIPGPAVKLQFAGKPADTPTGVTVPSVQVQVMDQFGNLITSDNSDVVTLGVGSGPGPFTSDSTVSATVVNGVASFSNLMLFVPGSYQLSAVVAGKYTGPYSPAFSIRPLEVLPGSLSGSPSGFSLQFNAPYLVNSLTPVLYGPATLPPSVIVTTDPGNVNDHGAYVAGTLYLSPGSNAITFLATNTTMEANTNSPVLPDGTYTVIVRGSAVNNGFQALHSGGGLLDGLATGVAGSGDYVGTFTVNAAGQNDDVLWVPSTADGPGQPLVAPGMNQLGGGYPIYLADGTGTVTSVLVTLNYDPALLNVTGVTGAGFTLLNSSVPGMAVLQYSGPALAAGSQTPIGYLTATVPSGTTASPMPYRAKDLLHLSNVALNGGSIPVVTSDGIHLVAYVGDANGDGTYSSDDAVRITRVTLQTDTGFAPYPLVDPVIVADTDGSGFIPSDAALQVNEAGVGVSTANLPRPPLPSGTHFQPIANNVDPMLSVDRGAWAVDRSTLTVAVNIDDAHPAGSTGLSEGHLALTYDPRAFTVSAADIHVGSVLAAGTGWSVVPTIDAATGQIAIALSSGTPITSTLGGSLVTIDFHQRPGEPETFGTFIRLVGSADPNGQYVTTELEDTQGTFALTLPGLNDLSGAFLGAPGTLSAEAVAGERQIDPMSSGDPQDGIAVNDAVDIAAVDPVIAAVPEAAVEESTAPGFAGPDTTLVTVLLNGKSSTLHPAAGVVAPVLSADALAKLSGFVFSLESPSPVSAPPPSVVQHPADAWSEALGRLMLDPVASVASFLAIAPRRGEAEAVDSPYSLNADGETTDLAGQPVGLLGVLGRRQKRDNDVNDAIPPQRASQELTDQAALDRWFALAGEQGEAFDEPGND